MAQRPAVVIIPDYDGIGPYELWRARLLAQMGYAGVNALITYLLMSPLVPLLCTCQAMARQASCLCFIAAFDHNIGRMHDT